jgi:N4-gp56 family major capsid protein
MPTVLNSTVTMNTGTGATATKPAAYYDRLLLTLLVQTSFNHDKFAQSRDLPKHYGDTINFRKITKLEASGVPLTEGVTPDGLNGSVEAISATVFQYGEYMKFTDLVDITMIDNVKQEYTVELARIMREMLDNKVRDELNGGSNVFYAGGKTSRATLESGDIPKVDDFRRIVLAMKKAFVKPTVGDRYVAFITPDVEFDLLDDPKFLKAYEIGQNNKPLIKGEIADVYGIKFITMQNAKVFEDAGDEDVDVHASIVLGYKTYGITKIKGEGNVQTVTKGLGSSGTEDPLNQRQSIGAKVNAFTAKRIYEEGICRYESVPTGA